VGHPGFRLFPDVEKAADTCHAASDLGCLDQKDLTLVVGQSEVVAVSGTRAVVGGLENVVGACRVGDDGCAGATSLDGLVDVRSRGACPV
jgi:hypothetical protein